MVLGHRQVALDGLAVPFDGAHRIALDDETATTRRNASQALLAMGAALWLALPVSSTGCRARADTLTILPEGLCDQANGEASMRKTVLLLGLAVFFSANPAWQKAAAACEGDQIIFEDEFADAGGVQVISGSGDSKDWDHHDNSHEGTLRQSKKVDQPIAASIAVPNSARLVVTEGNYLLAPVRGWPRVRAALDEIVSNRLMDEAAKKQGVTIEKHDILVLHTGWLNRLARSLLLGSG
jgi:hypothetical protein